MKALLALLVLTLSGCVSTQTSSPIADGVPRLLTVCNGGKLYTTDGKFVREYIVGEKMPIVSVSGNQNIVRTDSLGNFVQFILVDQSAGKIATKSRHALIGSQWDKEQLESTVLQYAPSNIVLKTFCER